MIIQQSIPFTTVDFCSEHKDVVFTPDHIAKGIIEFFRPAGRILDPCRGDGAFFKHMPSGAEYCELQEGKDFFNWCEHVNWIISNPPYSIYSEWLRHSFNVADNIVYLIPINKAFNSSSMLSATYAWGGIANIVHIGAGSTLGFPVGFAVGAVHYKRNYKGHINFRLNLSK